MTRVSQWILKTKFTVNITSSHLIIVEQIQSSYILLMFPVSESVFESKVFHSIHSTYKHTSNRD